MVGRSKVWQLAHFVDDDRLEVQCDLCNAKIRFSGNTTNIAKHLENKHLAEYRSLGPTPDSLIVPMHSKSFVKRKRAEQEPLRQLLDKHNKQLRLLKQKQLARPGRPKGSSKGIKLKRILSESSSDNDIEEDSIEYSPARRQRNSTSTTGPYVLKKEHHCNTILDELLNDQTYADITLSAEGKNIRAHRNILCLTSKYFREVLSEGMNTRNIVFFNDVTHEELKNMLRFIYCGEVTINAFDLDSFMKFGEKLQVTSLEEVRQSLGDRSPDSRSTEKRKKVLNNSDSTSSGKRVVPTYSEKFHPSKPRKISSSEKNSTFSNVVKATFKIGSNDQNGSSSEEYVIEGEVIDDSDYIDSTDTLSKDKQNNSLEHAPTDKCPFCFFVIPPSAKVLTHMQVCHPEKTIFPCILCSRVFLKEALYQEHITVCSG